jgi:hypothetical protein
MSPAASRIGSPEAFAPAKAAEEAVQARRAKQSRVN